MLPEPGSHAGQVSIINNNAVYETSCTFTRTGETISINNAGHEPGYSGTFTRTGEAVSINNAGNSPGPSCTFTRTGEAVISSIEQDTDLVDHILFFTMGFFVLLKRSK